VKLAVSMARQAEDGPAKVHVVTVVPYGCPENICVRAQQAIDSSLNGSRAYEYLTTRLLEGHGVTETVLQESEAHDLVVMGTTEEPLFQNLLTGSIPARVAKQAKMTVIIVKRRSGLIRSMLRQTVVPPSTGMGASDKVLPEADILLADDGELTADAD
jgi:nucleotide-binding universal stress UspA family protein